MTLKTIRHLGSDLGPSLAEIDHATQSSDLLDGRDKAALRIVPTIEGYMSLR
jgi:hypothetical protein